MNQLSSEHQERLDRELDEGEEIRWVSQPLYRVLRKSAMTNWLGGGVAVSLFVVFFLIMGWIALTTPKHDRSDEPWTFFAFAGAFVLLWGASYPLFVRWAKSTAHNTIYAITDIRVIILVLSKDGSTTERDYRGDELIHLARKENPDGTGTLAFESARGAGVSSGTTSRHRFQAIEDVIEVERLLRAQFGDA